MKRIFRPLRIEHALTVLALHCAACSSGASRESESTNLQLALAASGAPALAEAHPVALPSRADPLMAPPDPLITWVQQALLVPTNPVEDEFDSAIAASGNTILVGGSRSEDGAGAAFIFVRNGSTWTQQARLALGPNGSAVGYAFGRVAALDGDTAVVGGWNGDSVFVFSRSGSSWSEPVRLYVGGPLATQVAPLEGEFGPSVALSGDTVVVGAPGRNTAFVFARLGTIWSLQQSLIPGDGASSAFGSAIALFGDTLVIGAAQANLHDGAAYVFGRTGSSWLQIQKLTPRDVIGGEQFGASVSLYDGDLLVGCHSYSCRGSAYAFGRTGDRWDETQELVPSAFDAAYLSGVAIRGDFAFIGPSFFERAGSEWMQAQTFNQRGTSMLIRNNGVSLTGDYAAILEIPDWGESVVEILIRAPVGEPCRSATECASGHCVDGVCCDGPCTGACEACTVALGALRDGLCRVLPVRSTGSPPCTPLVCSGWSGTCSECVGDAQCPPDHVCAFETPNDIACLRPKGLGASCVDQRACASGNCVDGVCCDRACDGLCEACVTSIKGSGANGECGAIAAGLDPMNDCVDDGDACQRNGLCDGAGACELRDPDTCEALPCSANAECASGLCVDHVCCDRECLPTEACSAARKVSGVDGTCGPARAAVQGAPCTADATCSSGHCFDGVCCDRECDAPGEACAARLKLSGDDGTCGPTSSGGFGAPCERSGDCESGVCVDGVCCDEPCSDPGWTCSGELNASGRDGECGRERVRPLGSACSSASSCESGRCADGVCCDEACNAPGVACTAELKASGPDGRCGPARRGALGEPCLEDPDCLDGHCVDGLCCDRPCDSPVESCRADRNVSQSDGHCDEVTTAVLGSPCEDEASCASGHCVDGVCCDADCAGECEACAASARGDDGVDGECLPVAAGQDPAAECDSSSACSELPVCDGSGRCRCTPSIGCQLDGVTVALEGEDSGRDCSPYRCASGACLESCSTTADCAPGASCTSKGVCDVVVDRSIADNDAGCGCRTPGRDSGHRSATTSLVLLLLSLGGFRRVRARRPSSAQRIS